MIFNNFNFIFIFLPMFLLSYFLAGKYFKNHIILIYGILYYVFGNIYKPIYITIFILLILVNYLLYYLIYTENNSNIKRIKFLISIGLNVLIICIFKSGLIYKSIPSGLSFYTFHFISLLADSYKSEIKLKISFIKFMQYIVFFPKLLSGPITRYEYFNEQYENKKIKVESFILGLYLFSVGLALKCLLADNIYYIINQINVYGYDSISILTAWLGVYSFTMNLYFDFAGYSLMAIGIAKMIGMNLPENFNLPFSSKSVSEFWRRWHITLGQFFRDYIYIPLGGNFNNKNLPRQIINIIIVWIITGIWHGFKLNYLLWAMSICLVIIIEKIFLNKIYSKFYFIGKILVLIFIPFTFLIFSIENIGMLRTYISKLFDISSLENTREFISILKSYWKIFVIGMIFMTSFPRKLCNKIYNNKLLMLIFAIVFIIISCIMININSTDTFKYFTF